MAIYSLGEKKCSKILAIFYYVQPVPIRKAKSVMWLTIHDERSNKILSNFIEKNCSLQNQICWHHALTKNSTIRISQGRFSISSFPTNSRNPSEKKYCHIFLKYDLVIHFYWFIFTIAHKERIKMLLHKYEKRTTYIFPMLLLFKTQVGKKR